MAMTNAEKQRAYRSRQKQMGLKRAWIEAETGARPYDAGDLARDRLFTYLDEALRDPQGGREPEETRWELYTWLLSRAKSHKLDHSGYRGAALKQDSASAWLKREKTLAVTNPPTDPGAKPTRPQTNPSGGTKRRKPKNI